ncbi:MAG: helix-turn-helix transcriptional regulator [Cyclobacteriaceae bacterium]
MTHPDSEKNKLQAEYLNNCHPKDRRFNELMFMIGNATFRFHQLSQKFEVTEDLWKEWLEGLPATIKSEMEKQGFEECKKILAFTRYINERNDIGFEEFLKKNIKPEDIQEYTKLISIKAYNCLPLVNYSALSDKIVPMIGDIIKQKRILNNWTTRTLAEKAGITANMVSDYERGIYKPRTKVISKLARALDIPVSDLTAPDDPTQSESHKVIRKMAIANKLRELRESRHWSVRELAQRANINHRTVTRYETGKAQPSRQVIIKLASAFNIPFTELAEAKISKTHQVVVPEMVQDTLNKFILLDAKDQLAIRMVIEALADKQQHRGRSNPLD